MLAGARPGRRALFVAAVGLAAACPGRAQTLRQVLLDNDVPVSAALPFDPDRGITSYAVESGPEVFIVGYYESGPDVHLEDSLRIAVFDRSRSAWTGAVLARVRTAPPAWDVGSVLAIHHSASRIYIDTHTNPSAGTLIVLSRRLRPVAALSGWLLRLLPGGVAIHHASEVHFAPVHAAEIRAYDARTGRDAALYPRRPYDRVRLRYVDTVAAIYARLGEAWFAEHNRSMDASDFNSSLSSDVVADSTGTAVAFLMRFGDGNDLTQAATPVLDVVVRCDVPGRAGRCREMELEPLRRRHPGSTLAQLLQAAAADPAFH